MISATLYSDPACPWAYSAIPALRVIDWRYGDQIRWRLVLIGLSENVSWAEEAGYTPLRAAVGQLDFRRYGMPFSPSPKARMSASARACRAVVAARLMAPGSEWAVLRALQLANFNTQLLLDEEDQLKGVLDGVEGVDGARVIAQLDSPEVTEAYERDRAEARSAAGSPAQLQGKTATREGIVRFTAPTVIFESDGQRLLAGGFQPAEAYDVLVVNMDVTLQREAPPATPAPLLARFPGGITTQEVAALLAKENDAPDRVAAERELIGLVADGTAVREPLGDDALWKPRP